MNFFKITKNGVTVANVKNAASEEEEPLESGGSKTVIRDSKGLILFTSTEEISIERIKD